MIKAAINPLIVSSLIDREVLIKRVTLNAIGDSILMNKTINGLIAALIKPSKT